MGNLPTEHLGETHLPIPLGQAVRKFIPTPGDLLKCDADVYLPDGRIGRITASTKIMIKYPDQRTACAEQHTHFGMTECRQPY
jgi:hypothetical protein